jgi:hypothetical protein
MACTSVLPTFKAVEGIAVAIGIPECQALYLFPEVKGAASAVLVVAPILHSSSMKVNAWVNLGPPAGGPCKDWTLGWL